MPLADAVDVLHDRRNEKDMDSVMVSKPRHGTWNHGREDHFRPVTPFDGP